MVAKIKKIFYYNFEMFSDCKKTLVKQEPKVVSAALQAMESRQKIAATSS